MLRARSRIAAGLRSGGYVVEDVYVDDDISAWSGKQRPEFERMVDDLRSRRIGAVLVWHLDRLTRHPRELESFIDLCDELHVGLGCVTGEIDLGSHIGRLTARMLGGLARYESDHKSERIRRKHEEIAATASIRWRQQTVQFRGRQGDGARCGSGDHPGVREAAACR